MARRFRKFDEKTVKFIQRSTQLRVQQAGAALRDFLREQVSVSWPPASSPGDYPALRTGDFKRSIFVDSDRGKSRVGSRIKYGFFLEVGTRFMAPRPWLSRGMQEFRQQMIRTVSKKIPGG